MIIIEIPAKLPPRRDAPIPKRPVARLRMFPIEAVICCHTSDEGEKIYGVTFQRFFCDSKGRSKTSCSFNAADLPPLREVADLAHSKLIELYAADEKGNNPTA